jgi:hypothetical protein
VRVEAVLCDLPLDRSERGQDLLPGPVLPGALTPYQGLKLRTQVIM